MRGTFSRVSKDRYLWGNKNSRTLTRMLKKKRSIHFIEKIQNKNGEMVHNKKDIASVFRDFYEHLYLVRQVEGQGQQEAQKKRKKEKLCSKC